MAKSFSLTPIPATLIGRELIVFTIGMTEVIAADDALLVQEITGEAALANTMLRWSGRRISADGPNDYADGRVQASHPSPDRLPILPTKVAEAA
jgi:hypothetical protein